MSLGGAAIALTEACHGDRSGRRACARDDGPAAQAELVKRYCTGCHNDRSKAGELTLAGWDVTRASAQRELTEKMIHKLRAGMMPPSGARRPAPEQTLAVRRPRSNRGWTRSRAPIPIRAGARSSA